MSIPRLPKVDTVYHDLTIPSSGHKIRYRPFLVKEHKALLQAIELGSPDVFINTICNIVESCIDGNINIDNLTQYDVDYIFLNIRAKSVGEVVPVKYTCLNLVEKEVDPDPEQPYDEEDLNENGKLVMQDHCNTKLNIQLNLTEIKVVMTESYKNKATIKVNEDVGLKLKAPSFRNFRELLKEQREEDFSAQKFEAELIFSSVECLYEKDKIYFPGQDFTIEEFADFVDNLPTTALKEINNFFDEVPYVALKKKIKCPVCGNEDYTEIRELEDFFV